MRAGYADYWVAYKVDLLARGAMTINPAPGDVDRSATIDAQVARAPHQAWLFVPGPELATGYVQFSPTAVIVGPRAVTPDPLRGSARATWASGTGPSGPACSRPSCPTAT